MKVMVLMFENGYIYGCWGFGLQRSKRAFGFFRLGFWSLGFGCRL